MEQLVTKILAVFLTIIVTTEALNCYVCGHIENDNDPDDLRTHPSCAAGKEPKSEFTSNCNDLEYFEMVSGTFIGNPKGGPQGAQPIVDLKSIFGNSKITYSCITFSIESEPRHAGDNHRTTRTCAVIKGAVKPLQDECYDQNSNVALEQQWFETAVIRWRNVLPGDTKKLGVCNCFSDNCNGASTFSSASLPSVNKVLSNFLQIFLGGQLMRKLFLYLE